MRNFIMSTDITCDLPEDILVKYNIKSLNMTYSIDNVEYSNNNSISTKEFCDYMRKGSVTKTSAINCYDAREYFEKLLTLGQDILHISFSSGLSSSYTNAHDVANELNKTNHNKIYVIDSLCACSGQGLLCILGCEKADSGESIEDVKNYLEKIKFNITHLFTVDDLKYLVRGGRVSKTKAKIASALKIKPVLHVDNEGKLVQYKTVISRKKSIMTMCDDFISNYSNVSNKILISHADCLEDAQLLQSFIKNKTGLESELYELGHVICSHSGPGTLALFFVGNKR